MRNPDEVGDCNFLSLVDFVVADRMNRCCCKAFDKVNTFDDVEEEEVVAIQIDWTEEKQFDRHTRFIEHLNLSDREIAIALEDQEKTTFTCPYGTFAFRRMPFGLCNAPTTFQRCMISIFSDMVEQTLEVFMDDFSVFGETYNNGGIMLGHKVSKDGIEVDKAKIEVIDKLLPPTSVKGIRSFLGHVGFYRRFIKDFSKVAKPLCSLLEHDKPFYFDKACHQAFGELKKALITAPVIISPDWTLPFELMCDASDHSVGAVLGQRKDKQVQMLQQSESLWYADFANYLVSGLLPPKLKFQEKKKFLHNVRSYQWDDPHLYKLCPDQVIRRCAAEGEIPHILESCHAAAYRGHFGGHRTAAKVLQLGYYWLTIFKDAYEFVKYCDRCQRTGNITSRHEMPLTNILEVEVFDVWGIYFMELFPPSFGNLYILIVVDYVSKWVEAAALPTDDAKTVVAFLQKFFFPNLALLEQLLVMRVHIFATKSLLQQ
ncbi:uncharacterized protein LOC127903086 [Citrus sinensis]|uniref:uncharacterized protein LOC127903086 n=1 Tax=Citrus sinensis TaxID=2711 RepID=UPI002277F46F|nr:uncharacterized protein LOC127903086 [Citrus sinensis]